MAAAELSLGAAPDPFDPTLTAASTSTSTTAVAAGAAAVTSAALAAGTGWIVRARDPTNTARGSLS
jgi:NAD/NADP transhydrogenase alpha subunit